MDFSSSFNDPELCRSLLDRLRRELDCFEKPVRFMEVCGTHTVSIFQSGLRSLLPQGLVHLSGPGCPVCVTHDSEVAAFLEVAAREDVILATFGDLMRVPGPDGRSLKHAKADGADIRVLYSPLDALALARKNPDRNVVFLGVGFETTAPAVAGTILAAQAQSLDNFTVLSCHKLVPPALNALLAGDGNNGAQRLDAFLLPGHVALVLGLEPFRFLAETYARPAVVAGFEPADILAGLCVILERLRSGKACVDNAYGRAVSPQGSPQALNVMRQVFTVKDARWRGLGDIPQSGLSLAPAFERFDAFSRLGVQLGESRTIPGCRCGDVLSGKLAPNQCPLFGKACTPMNPTGPCMVSTEGSCAAWFKYQGGDQ